MPIRIKERKKETPETRLKRAAKEYLDLTGWYHFPLLQGLGAYPGLPDRIAIKNGHVVFIEFKSPKGRQSDHQKRFQARLEGHNGRYLLVSSIDDLIAWLTLI